MEEQEQRGKLTTSSKGFLIRGNSSYNKKTATLGSLPSPEILESFVNSTVLNHSLKVKRVPVGKVQWKAKSKGNKDTNLEITRDGFETELQKLNKLKEEVKALPSSLKPINNPRTYNMILAQKRDRRMRHIKELQDFEAEIASVKDLSESKVSTVKNDVDAFETSVDITIASYFSSLTDYVLLEKEDEILEEIESFVYQTENKLQSKLQNINEQLDECEDEFYDSIQQEVDDLKETLIEIAFKLAPEIHDIVEDIRKTFKEDIENAKSLNKEYYDALEKRILERIESIKTQGKDKEARWRILKHNQTMELFNKEINSEQYRHPQSRVDEMENLEHLLRQVYEDRISRLAFLESIPAGELSKQRIGTYLTGIREANDRAQQAYDSHIETIIAVKSNHMSEVKKFIDYIKSRIEHYDADLGERKREELYIQDLDSQYNEIRSNQERVIQEVIDFMEERDKIQNNICLNIGHNYQSFGERMDKYIVDYTQTENKFEYEKGVLEDQNDDKLKELATILDHAKTTLRNSVDHIKLDDHLEACFEAVDAIVQEFRDFHSQNLEVVKKHAPFIQEMFNKLEDDFARLMELRPLEDRADLEEIALKITRWKAKLATDEFFKNEEANEEMELQELMEKNKDNKKFKPPTKKKAKNEKQLQAEWKELFDKNCEKFKKKVVQIDDIGTGNARIIARSLEAFIKTLSYPCKEEAESTLVEDDVKEKKDVEQPSEDQSSSKARLQTGKNKNTKASEEEEIAEIADPEDVVPYVDEHAIPNYENGKAIFSSDFSIEHQFLETMISEFRQNIFNFLARKMNECLNNAELNDKEFIEISLVLLDERLKSYYPVKGKIQTDIYLIRSGEITQHKSNYEMFVSKLLDRLDEQTDRFNFYYQEIFDEKKSHTERMDGFIKSLPEQKQLTTLQGVLAKARDADLKIAGLMGTALSAMKRLGQEELDSVLKEINSTIETYKRNSVYSKSEIEWYDSMIEEIRQKIEVHRSRRAETLQEISDLCEKRKAEAFQKFEAAYEAAVDELSARDAKGKVFGQPKRAAQNIARSEMALVSKVESYLQEVVGEFKKTIQEGYVGSLSLRSKMMSFRACCFFYGNYLEAFKEDSPLADLPRVTYIENKFGIGLGEEEVEDDDQRKEEELKPLQRLYYRGDEVKFSQKIKQVEDIVKVEAAKLYVGDYAKLLGADKLTDVLRDFTASLKEEMADFRLSSIRQLRMVVEEFLDLTPEINSVLFSSILKRCKGKLSQDSTHIEKLFTTVIEQAKLKQEEHILKLRPNLSHPENIDELELLNETESKRHNDTINAIEKNKLELEDLWFRECNEYFMILLNNLEFTLVFYDNWILAEDIIKLPGDENVEKKHFNLKKLLIMEQKGELTDTSSLRALKKAWKTYLMNMFSIEGRPQYAFKEEDEQNNIDPKDKGGKKKDTKKKEVKKKVPAGKEKGMPQKNEIKADREEGKTKPLISFKSKMQKSSFYNFETSLQSLKTEFDAKISSLNASTESHLHSEHHFQYFWETTNKRLFDDSL